MSQDFEDFEETEEFSIQRQELKNALDTLVDILDNLDSENIDKLDVKIKLKGKFNAKLFYNILEEYLGVPDNGAVNPVARSIGMNGVAYIIDEYNYNEMEDSSGNLYNIIVAVGYDLVNGKTVLNPSFYAFAEKVKKKIY